MQTEFKPLTDHMNAAIAVKQSGAVCLLHDAPFDQRPGWLEVDRSGASMTLIMEDGFQYPLNFDLGQDTYQNLHAQAQLYVLYVENKTEIKASLSIPIVIHGES